jgi:hypothetical protein
VVMTDSLLRWAEVVRGRRNTVPAAGEALPEAAGL